MLDHIKNPEIEYYPYNYWGWLENIEPAEVKWQIAEMAKAGIGGYVMHARGGLLMPYMGQQWQDSVRAMIDEGKKHGMVTIIDDEDGWPSGFGAGKVNGQGEAYWLKWLECATVKRKELVTTANTLGVYKLNGADAGIRIHDLSQINEEDELIHIYYESSKYYVDNLNPEVVQAFIEASYEDYYSKFSEEFGTGIAAIFSDEPQIARDRISWSWILPETFKTKYGYDLIDSLPAIYYDITGHEKVRYDFWNLLSALFTESYSKQIGEWCGDHKVSLLGHTSQEDNLAVQMMSSGSTMPFYEYMQVPGIDWLCRIPLNNMTMKQVTSVAQQLGKKRILSEMYGCAGWNISFEELKWIGEWHYVLGIDLMLQHLGLYSLKGSRKREYPASLFYQQPWWDEFKPFNEYFARLSKLISESTPIIDILVLHPMRSAWVALRGMERNKVDVLDAEFKLLTENLLRLNYDFHYGDEEIMLRYGKVEGNQLIIGQSSYATVLIPPSLSLDKNTLDLLTQFSLQGGKIISLGSFPTLLAGSPSEEIAKFEQKTVRISNTIVELDSTLSKAAVRKIHVSSCDGSLNESVFSCTRTTADETIYYIVNTNKDKGYDININLADSDHLTRLNLADFIEIETSPADLNGVHLDPTESIILISRAGNLESTVPSNTSSSTILQESISLDGEWNVTKTDLNAITLDYCKYSIENGPWNEEMPVILLQEKLIALGRSADVSIKFTFELDFAVKSPLYIVLEEPEQFSIQMNGKPLIGAAEGWWIDKSFKKIPIHELIQIGENEIILQRHFYCSDKVYNIKNDSSIHEAESNRVTIDTELESIYLLGDFSVNAEGSTRETDRRALFVEKSFKLTAPRKKVLLDNLVTQGYPFYAGSISLTKTFNVNSGKQKLQAQLQFDKPDAIVTRVWINGAEVKTFLWAPYQTDVTAFISDGENEITVDLVNSCRNLLGPHHHSQGELYTVGPLQYKESQHWTDDYCLVRLGLSQFNIHIYTD